MSVMDEPCELGRPAEELVESGDIEPRRRLGLPDCCAVTAVGPVRRMRADARLDRVSDDVEDRGDEIGVAIHLEGERSILEQMRLPPVPAIRAAGVIAV